MTRATFFKHFELLADQPDAVARMRELVLELAVRGKLVPQNLKDEPAAKLLERICQEKDKLGKRGKNQTDASPSVAADETSFDVPPGWVWARTQHVTIYVQRGKSPKYSTEQKVPVIAQKCIQWHGFELHKAQFIEPASLASYSEDRFVLDGDLLWNSTGLGTLGRIIVFRNRFKGEYPRIVADSHVTVIRPSKLVVSDYLFLWFAGPKVQNEINAKASGSTKQTELATSTVLSYAIPLPPLAEQRRIVAKVDELLALCDELEQRQQARQHARAHLTQSAYHHLTTAQDPADFRRRLNFILHNSSFILDDVPQLRQAILQLAVQGRLVPQHRKDGNGADVISKHSIRELPDADHILDLTLPAHWAISAFANLARIRSGVTKGRDLKGRKTKSFPYLRVANVQRGYLDLDVVKDIEIPLEELVKFRLQANDLLVVEGGDWDKVGRTAIWREEVADCIHQNHVFRARLVSEELHPEWFMLYLNSPVGRRYFESAAKQTTNLASINASELRACPVPLPPLAEQKRIVARVEELLRWCDTLEAQLHQTRTLGAHLLASTLHHLLEA